MRRRRFIWLVGTGLVGVPVAVACQQTGRPEPGLPSATAGSAATPTPRPHQALIWGSSQGVERLDPQATSQAIDVASFDCVYEHLVDRTLQSPEHPRLALSWTNVNDTTWQFKLRPGVKFHNGDPFTAADVKFTIDRTKDESAKTIHATTFATVTRVDVVDDLTVNMITDGPDPLLIGRLAYNGAWILPSRYLQQVGIEQFERAPVGTGPFRFVEHVKDRHLKLAANADYWGGAPAIDELIIKPIPEPAARLTALMSTDEINFTERLPADDVERVRNNPTTKVESSLQDGIYVYTLNQTNAPLNSKPLRQALSIGIDREAILKNLLLGQGAVLNGPIPAGDFAYNQSRPPIPYDPSRARDLVKQSGYDGSEILLEVVPNVHFANDHLAAQAVVDMWKDIGVNVRIEQISAAVRGEKQRAKSYTGIYPSSLSSALQDPDGLMYRVMRKGGILDYGWNKDEFVRLGAEASTSLNQDLRRANYDRMVEIVLDEVPAIPLFTLMYTFGMKRYVTYTPGPGDRVNFRRENMSFQ